MVGLFAQSEGSMVISFSEASAEAVVKRVLSSVEPNPSVDMIRDCIGEIANVIAGQARGKLGQSEYQFSISTPTIVSGPNHEIRHKPGTPCMVIAFSSELGDFALQLCVSC